MNALSSQCKPKVIISPYCHAQQILLRLAWTQEPSIKELHFTMWEKKEKALAEKELLFFLSSNNTVSYKMRKTRKVKSF